MQYCSSVCLFVCLTFSLKVAFAYYFKKQYENIYDVNLKNLLFKNESSILNYLEQEKNKQPSEILMVQNAYYSTYKRQDNSLPYGRRRPFIVIEGNNFANRDQICARLAETLGTSCARSPPRRLFQVRNVFARKSVLKYALYLLSAYTIAYNARQMLGHSPVIANGFWTEQVAYIIAVKHRDPSYLPERGHRIYESPHDLMMPDILFFLNYTWENSYSRTLPYLDKTLKIYRRFKRPPVVVVKSTDDVDATVNEIRKKMTVLLGDHFDLSNSTYLDMQRENSILKESFVKSKEAILSFFEKQKVTNPSIVNEVLKAYNKCVSDEDVPLKSYRKKPFIVIEGNNYVYRENVARRLVDIMHGTYEHIPPVCMSHMKNIFVKGTLLKHAFHLLSVYALEHKVRQWLAKDQTVVSNGFWTEQASIVIRNSYDILPPWNDAIYMQPRDLKAIPDAIFFINYTSTEMGSTKSNRPLNSKSYRILRQFHSPSVIIIDGSKGLNYTISLIIQELKIVLPESFIKTMLFPVISEKKRQNLNKEFKTFKDEQSIMSYLDTQRVLGSTAAGEFLEIYKANFFNKSISLPIGKRKVFIVIEGNNFEFRALVAESLREAIGGEIISFPPDELLNIRNEFIKGSILKHAYHLLSVYASAVQVKQTLASGVPVIMNGYWTEQVAFIIGKLFRTSKDLPLPGDEIYQHPKDLIQPDMLIFMNSSITGTKSLFSTTVPKTFRIYEKFNSPPVTFFNGSTSIKNTATQVNQKMGILLRNKFDLDYVRDLDSHQHQFLSKNILFESEERIVSFFSNQESNDTDRVKSILQAYRKCLSTMDLPVPPGKRRPFIVIEGNNFRNREAISKNIAGILKAKLLYFPPDCMAHLKDLYEKDSVEQYALNQLSVYAAGFKARRYIAKGIPVVMNGYWSEQASIIIGKIFPSDTYLPKHGSFVYKPPKNLMIPDMTFYLNMQNSFSARMKHSPAHRKRVHIYERFNNPPVTIIDTTTNIEPTTNKINEEMKFILGDKFDFGKKRGKGEDLQSKYNFTKNEKSLLSFFEKKGGYQELLDSYKECFNKGQFHVPLKNRRPFIVIEGSNYNYRERVAHSLALSMKAVVLHIPPRCLYMRKKMFKNRSIEKQAFFSLSLYAAANNVKQLLEHRTPIVMNGYWSEQAALIIGQIYRRNMRLPPAGSKIYDQPKDLLMPDILVYLNYTATEKDTNRFTLDQKGVQRVLQVYRCFNYPPVKIISSTLSIQEVVGEIHKEMNIMFGKNLDLSLSFPYNLGVTPHNIQETYFSWFKNEKSILSLFEKEKEKHFDAVESFQRCYKYCYIANDITLASGKRKPFIVIEGKNYNLRETVAKDLANILGGKLFHVLPKCINGLRNIFERGSLLKHALHSVALYPVAFNTRHMLAKGIPVIMNGYWFEQTIHVMKKVFKSNEEMPPIGNAIYNPPEDLMMPDILIYLNSVNPAGEKNKLYSRDIIDNSMIDAYKRFNITNFVVIDYQKDGNITIARIQWEMNNLIGRQFDLSPGKGDNTITHPYQIKHV